MTVRPQRMYSLALATSMLLLVLSRLSSAEVPSNSTIDLLNDWPQQWVDPRRSDAARRPAYQRTPGHLLTASAPDPVSGQSGNIALQTFDTLQGEPQVMPLDSVATFDLPVGPPEAWWVDAEYLYWWIKGMKNTPPLVTTSNDVDLGRIGETSTRVLFPTAALFQSPGSGGRIRFGHWWNAEHTQGIAADLWGLNGPSERFSISSAGIPLIARPFFDSSSGSQNSEVVAISGTPSARSGGVSIDADSALYSGGVVWRWQLGFLRPGRARPCRNAPASFQFLPRGDIRLDFTCGYRYARLQERLSIFENVILGSGDRFDVEDHFRTTNDFNGAEIGLLYTHHHCRWSFEFRPRIAFGGVRQRTQINGNTLSTPSGGTPLNESGGLLALAGTNIGTFTRDEFSILPQVDARLGYRIMDRLTMTLGYSFLYWMRVARPGEQIDFRVNPNYFPSSSPFDPPPTPPLGPRDPRPLFADAAFWAQGLNLGLEYRF
ncbi:MAG: BBP7 family outer membrane beta-barrel protein [Planctomycetota bacterium]|nr:BBP7 family outer membrane beta-barrel protein [Planctomycetota bacterium]